MMMSLLECLDKAWEMQVFPQPKAPGMAQVPPRMEGNIASRTLWPVIRGTSPANFSTIGLDCLTGHLWLIEYLVFFPSSSSSRTSSWILYSPGGAM